MFDLFRTHRLPPLRTFFSFCTSSFFLCLLPSLPSDRHLSINSQDSPLVASTHQARIAQSQRPTHRLAQAAAPIRLAPLTALASRASSGSSPCWKYSVYVSLSPFCLRRFGLLALTVEYLTTIQPFLPFLAPFPCSPLLTAMYIRPLSWPQPRSCNTDTRIANEILARLPTSFARDHLKPPPSALYDPSSPPHVFTFPSGS